MNEKIVIGKVTGFERDEIKALHERKNGLSELFKSINLLDNEPLYEKIVKDMGETASKFQKWWDIHSQTYNWENKDGYSWEINFDTCEIFLAKH
jgi:CXXX repeat modification system protein